MEARPPEGPSSRYKILWAAATMLGGDSATTPSVRAVAVRAGVSAGSVQHHFPTQRELMDEVLILVYDTVLQAEGLLRRIEYCLTVLQKEGSLAQALPAETSLLPTELEVLRMAADYVLNEQPPSEAPL